MAWVRWSSVCLPKENGGLGIKDISMLNSAFLAKWLWHLIHEQHAI